MLASTARTILMNAQAVHVWMVEFVLTKLASTFVCVLRVTLGLTVNRMSTIAPLMNVWTEQSATIWSTPLSVPVSQDGRVSLVYLFQNCQGSSKSMDKTSADLKKKNYVSCQTHKAWRPLHGVGYNQLCFQGLLPFKLSSCKTGTRETDWVIKKEKKGVIQSKND